ncbi:hypothetical protein [Photorhabdus luminescens]|uniref:Uncharacterized protein n=1 Tax=Photorhabdus luminescens subsp. mexicana TaxID=2100167 RepID=A0A4R4JFX0_PHOLU|nr:hypothetical protein [Photorhabdus luminescens]TDB53040.1 hypothetical protein C5468_08920 [Photorhabdus luminescens subsp. mexicana]
MNRQCETLKEYIDRHFGGNQSKFAQHMHVTPQQVAKWIAGNWIVVNDILYSPKRRIENAYRLRN